MKKILSVILSLMLMCSCTFAFAEAVPETVPETAPVKLALNGSSSMNVNGDMIAQLIPMLTGTSADENTTALMNAITSLLNKASFGFVAQEDGAKMTVSIGETAVADVTLSLKDDKVLLESSVLPSYAFDFTAPVQQVLAAVQQAFTYIGENGEKISALLQSLTTEVMTAFAGMYGEAQTVEVVDGDVTYVTAIPVSMTVGQAGELYVKIIDVLAADEFVQSLIASMGGQQSQETIAQIRGTFEKLAALKGTENDGTIMNGTVYASADGKNAMVDMVGMVSAFNNVTDATMSGSEAAVQSKPLYERYVAKTQELEAGVHLDIDVMVTDALPADGNWAGIDPTAVKSNVSTVIDATDEAISGVMMITVSGMQIAVKFDETFDFSAGLACKSTESLYFMDMTTPLLTATSTIQTVPAGEIAIAEGKQLVDITAMTDEVGAAIGADVQTNGLGLLMQTLYAAAPDEMMVIINALTPQQTTETTETTVPVTTPVVVAP